MKDSFSTIIESWKSPFSYFRWYNHLNPDIKRTAWTKEEELTLIKVHQVYGNRWAEIAKFLPGRY